MKRVIFLFLISFFLFSGVASAQLMDSTWAMFGSDVRHTGQSLYESNSNGIKKWSYTTGADILSSPAIANDGTIYVGSDDDNLYAIYPNGTKKWNFTTGADILSSPAIANDGTIYVGSDDDNLYAIYPNGTKKWNFTTGADILSSPAIANDGTIYVGSYDNKLYAINPDGTEKWNYTAGSSYIFSSPALADDGVIYFGSLNGKLYSLYPNGTEKWNYSTGSIIYSSPAISADGIIYFGSQDNKLNALYPNGTEKWNYVTNPFIYASPSISNEGVIYVGSLDGKLYAINPDGTEKWNYVTGADIFSSPAIDSNGIIYVGSDDNKLYAIYSNGTKKWNYVTGADIFSSPAIDSNGIIYVGSDDNKLYAFESIVPTITISSAITQNSVPLTSTLITGDDSTGGFVSKNGQITLEPNERDNKTFSLEVTDSALIDGFELAITANSADVSTLSININNLGADRTYNIYLDGQFIEKIGEVATYQYNMTSFSTHTLKVEYDISDEDCGGGGSGSVTPPDEDLIEIGELILTKDEFDLLTIEQIESMNVSQDTKDKLIAIKSINVNWWLFILVISLTALIFESSHKKGHESIIIISFIGVVISAYKLGYF